MRFWHQTSVQLWFRLFCVTSYEDFDQLWVSVQHFVFLKAPLDSSNTETKWNETFKVTNGKPTAYMQKNKRMGIPWLWSERKKSEEINESEEAVRGWDECCLVVLQGLPHRTQTSVVVYRNKNIQTNHILIDYVFTRLLLHHFSWLNIYVFFFKHFETLWLLLLQIWTHFRMLISSETLGDTSHLAIEILQRSSFWFYFHSCRLYLLCLWCRHLLWLLHKHLHRDKSLISLFDHWLLILMNISVLSQSSQIKIRSSQ